MCLQSPSPSLVWCLSAPPHQSVIAKPVNWEPGDHHLLRRVKKGTQTLVSYTFCQLSNPFLILLWTTFLAQCSRAQKLILWSHLWSFEVKIAQSPTRVSCPWGQISFLNHSWVWKQAYLFPVCPEINFSIYSLSWTLTQLKVQLCTCTVWISPSHSQYCLPSSCFIITNVSPWSRSSAQMKQNLRLCISDKKTK